MIVILVAALLVSATFAGYFLLQYEQAQNNSNHYLTELKQASGATPLTTDILLNLGNGTRTWYNGTVVQPGWNLYLATVDVTRGNMNATWDAQYGEHIINGIDGIQNTQNASWWIWSYNSTSSWQLAQTGADEIPAFSGSVYAWSFCGTTPSFAPTCAHP